MNIMNNDFDPVELRRALRRQQRGVAQQGFFRGRWTSVTAWQGKPKQSKKLWSVDFNNGITTIGMNWALDRFSNVGTPAAETWYAGLIDAASFSGVDASDTSASHSGWIENTDYDESVRQTLNFGAAAARTISDSVSFTMNATVTINGLFVISENTKGGATGILFSTALFATAPNLVSGNTLTANYSLSD